MKVMTDKTHYCHQCRMPLSATMNPTQYRLHRYAAHEVEDLDRMLADRPDNLVLDKLDEGAMMQRFAMGLKG